MTGLADYTYDLFVSYAEADRAWVGGCLLDALTQVGLPCHSEAAFAPAIPRILGFERAVHDSQRTLLFRSPAHLTEALTQSTELLAQSYGLETAVWPLIFLIIESGQTAMPPGYAHRSRCSGPDAWHGVLERLSAHLWSSLVSDAADLQTFVAVRRQSDRLLPKEVHNVH
jgi:hypothetical protein